jgi:hypothetical protein
MLSMIASNTQLDFFCPLITIFGSQNSSSPGPRTSQSLHSALSQLATFHGLVREHSKEDSNDGELGG